jgi:large subunit ribosomal protein L23
MSTKNILIRPFVTEKTSALMEEGHYVFVVAKDANKLAIRQAVQARYPEVQIDEVRTMIQRGKRRRQITKRGLMEGTTTGFKKAIVTLKEGSEPIDFFEAI